MKLRADLHVHSHFSFDSNSSLKNILKTSKRRGLDVIAITDHDSVKGGELAAKIAKEIIIITGQEIDTEYGDIIGLFLKKKVNSKRFSEAVAEIKKQNGIILLPHPAKYHILTDEILRKVDLLETFNSRLRPEVNNMAKLLAKETKKPGVAGSDAHELYEIGCGVNEIESSKSDLDSIKEALLKGRVKIIRESRPSKLFRAISLTKKILRNHGS